MSAACPDSPVATSSQTNIVVSEETQPDEANPASATIFSNAVLMSETTNPSGGNSQDHQSEPPVFDHPCFPNNPYVMKWYINPNPKLLPNLSIRKILSNRPLSHPAPSDVLRKDLALGFVKSIYFCSRDVMEIMVGP